MSPNSYRRKKIVKLAFKILLLLVGILFDVFILLSVAGKLDRIFFVIGVIFGPSYTFLGVYMLMPNKLSAFTVLIILGCVIIAAVIYLLFITSLNIKGSFA